ncbi:unnamed protein product [Ranitomeya imitator]|uniref:Uncharacterized protein n=1 Tax=Ranitomeya imitator TaxID=111125 RepID=A0ABN9KS23_9NEOB|nr:unnamed protein product [Ranitomeya imitator]
MAILKSLLNPFYARVPEMRKHVKKEMEEDDVQLKDSNPLNPGASRKAQKNYSRKTAVVSQYTNDDRSGCEPYTGTSNIADVSSSSVRSASADLFSEAPRRYKPRRTQNASASQVYEEDPRYKDANHELGRDKASSSASDRCQFFVRISSVFHTLTSTESVKSANMQV